MKKSYKAKSLLSRQGGRGKTRFIPLLPIGPCKKRKVPIDPVTRKLIRKIAEIESCNNKEPVKKCEEDLLELYRNLLAAEKEPCPCSSCREAALSRKKRMKSIFDHWGGMLVAIKDKSPRLTKT
jgi:hypothetical protein